LTLRGVSLVSAAEISDFRTGGEGPPGGCTPTSQDPRAAAEPRVQRSAARTADREAWPGGGSAAVASREQVQTWPASTTCCKLRQLN